MIHDDSCLRFQLIGNATEIIADAFLILRRNGCIAFAITLRDSRCAGAVWSVIGIGPGARGGVPSGRGRDAEAVGARVRDRFSWSETRTRSRRWLVQPLGKSR